VGDLLCTSSLQAGAEDELAEKYGNGKGFDACLFNWLVRRTMPGYDSNDLDNAALYEECVRDPA
jgi:hypothetical protein